MAKNDNYVARLGVVMKFWKDGWSHVIGVFIVTLMPLTLAVVGLVTYLESGVFYMLVAGCVMFIVCVLVFLTKLSKVIITDEGVEIKYGKKQLAYINWFDVTKVDAAMIPRTWYLIFFSDEKRIEVALSPKLYQTIMDLCPSLFVRTQLDSLPILQDKKQWLEKRRDKKK